MQRIGIAAAIMAAGVGLAGAEDFAGLPPDWREETIALCRERWPSDHAMALHCLQEQEKAALGIASIDVGAGVPDDVGLGIVSECERQWRPDIEMFSHCLVEQAAAWRALNR